MPYKINANDLPSSSPPGLPWEKVGHVIITTNMENLASMVADVAAQLNEAYPEINTVILSNTIGSKSHRSEKCLAMRAVLDGIGKKSFSYRIEAVY